MNVVEEFEREAVAAYLDIDKRFNGGVEYPPAYSDGNTQMLWSWFKRGWECKKATLDKLIDQQAMDEGLWFVAPTASEAYLQQALRKLHVKIEGQ